MAINSNYEKTINFTLNTEKLGIYKVRDGIQKIYGINRSVTLVRIYLFSKERETAKPKVEEVVETEEGITHEDNEWGSYF